MTKDNILELYDMPKQKAMVFINQIFKMFDKDGSGSISFRVGIEQVRDRTGVAQHILAISNPLILILV